MYNIRADDVADLCSGGIITASVDKKQDNMSSFLRNCMRSFRTQIEPSLPGVLRNQDIQVTSVVVRQRTPPAPPLEDDGLFVVSKSILCALEGRLFTGNHYAFLMTHPLHGKKTSANVGYSTNPAYEVYLHNHLLINDRTTSAAAPHWILDMVLGPFISVEKAIECSKEWVSNTRGMESKRKRANLLSCINSVPLYDVAKKPAVPLREYLAKTAPAIYSQQYQRMVASPKKKKREALHRKKTIS